MRWLLAIIAISAPGQTLRIAPTSPKQGDALRISARAPAASARMLQRTIRLFQQPSGERFGLMPVAANQAPGRFRIEILGEKGAVLQSRPVAIRDAHFRKQNVTLVPKIQDLRAAPGEADTVAAFRNTVSEVRHWQEPFTPPIAGCMSSPFGVQRSYNGKPSGNYHGGIDEPSPAGRPVHAIAAGTVKLVRAYNVHGNVVGVDHGQGLASMYLHLSGFAVAEGAAVKAGDVVGYVGSTGRSTAPHLHWSVYANGVAVNPAQWIPVKPCAAKKKTRARTRRLTAESASPHRAAGPVTLRTGEESAVH